MAFLALVEKIRVFRVDMCGDMLRLEDERRNEQPEESRKHE